jgi:hypothetical protein
VYDAESQELLEELQGTSEVQSVAIWDSGKDGGKDGVERTLTSPSRSSEAVSWPRITAGAQSGELYNLEMM